MVLSGADAHAVECSLIEKNKNKKGEGKTRTLNKVPGRVNPSIKLGALQGYDSTASTWHISHLIVTVTSTDATLGFNLSASQAKATRVRAPCFD